VRWLTQPRTGSRRQGADSTADADVPLLLQKDDGSTPSVSDGKPTGTLRYLPLMLVRQKNGAPMFASATSMKARVFHALLFGRCAWFPATEATVAALRAPSGGQTLTLQAYAADGTLRRQAYDSHAALEAHGVIVSRYRGGDADRTQHRRAIRTLLAAISPYTLLVDFALTVAVAVSQGLATVNCDAACGVALTANLIGVLHALLVRPYSIASKNVLLVAMNGLMFGASVATTRAIKAESEAESTAMAQLASQAAAAAAMLGFVGIGLTLMRLLLTRVMVKATFVVDVDRLSFSKPTALAPARLGPRTVDDPQPSVAIRAAPAPAQTASPTPPSGAAPSRSHDTQPAVDDGDDNESHDRDTDNFAGLLVAPARDYFDAGQQRRLYRTGEGARHYAELEAMLRRGDGDNRRQAPPLNRPAAVTAPPTPLDLDDVLGIQAEPHRPTASRGNTATSADDALSWLDDVM
jgi:hypothetical protein